MNNGPIIEKNGSVGLFHEVIYGLWMFVVDTSLVYWGCHLAVDKPHWCQALPVMGLTEGFVAQETVDCHNINGHFREDHLLEVLGGSSPRRS